MATSTDLRAAIEEVQNQLPEDQLAGDFDELYEADLATKLEQRVGALPWWVISAVVHSVIFLLCTLIGVALPPPNMDEVSITTDMAKKEEPKYDQKKKRDIFKNPQEVKAETQVENPVVIHEQTEVTDHFETDNNMDNQNARGSEDAISDIPLGGTGVTGSMGVGGGGMAGCFGYRDGGGRRKAVARFGGSPATESSVEAALRWLKRHQEPDGHWDSKKYGASSYGRGGDVGVTGLALLAFLGAGHTEKSGKFRDNVRRAQVWLIKQQNPKTGEINQKRPGHNARPYNHSIAALALAEAYGMTKSPALKGPAQKAMECVNNWQNPYAGWRYNPKDGDNDPSVTGWMLMVVKSSKIAGLKVDMAAYQGGLKFLNAATYKKGRREGKTHYLFKNGGSYGRWQSMTSVSLFCRLLMGYPRTDALLKKQADWLASDPPDWEKSKGNQSHSEYYWYYGTLAMFQMGGKHWQDWNVAMKKALLPNQRKGGPMDGTTDDIDGSWDPISTWGKYGGRVYTTAINALSLEVYYRYLPIYTK
jgi:hypothetical protein